MEFPLLFSMPCEFSRTLPSRNEIIEVIREGHEPRLEIVPLLCIVNSQT